MDKDKITIEVQNDEEQKTTQNNGCGCVGCFTVIFIPFLLFIGLWIADYNKWFLVPHWILFIPKTIWGWITTGLWWILIICVGFVVLCLLLVIGEKLFAKPIRKFNRWRVVRKLPKIHPSPRSNKRR